MMAPFPTSAHLPAASDGFSKFEQQQQQKKPQQN